MDGEFVFYEENSYFPSHWPYGQLWLTISRFLCQTKIAFSCYMIVGIRTAAAIAQTLTSYNGDGLRWSIKCDLKIFTYLTMMPSLLRHTKWSNRIQPSSLFSGVVSGQIRMCRQTRQSSLYQLEAKLAFPQRFVNLESHKN